MTNLIILIIEKLSPQLQETKRDSVEWCLCRTYGGNKSTVGEIIDVQFFFAPFQTGTKILWVRFLPFPSILQGVSKLGTTKKSKRNFKGRK